MTQVIVKKLKQNSNYKVLVIPEFSSSPSGGARSFFYKLLSIHKKNNISTAVLLEKYQADDVTITKCTDTGASVSVIPNRDPGNRSYLFSLLSGIKNFYSVLMKYKPDVVVISNKAPGMNFGIFLFPVRVVFFMHTYPHFRLPPLQNRITRLIGKYCITNKKKIITVSQYASKKIATDMGVALRSIGVIYNSYNIPVENDLIMQEPFVLTVGHVVQYKNPQIWLKVAQTVIAQNESCRFIWVGEGDMLSFMRGEVNRLGLDNRITFLGFSDRVYDFYKKSSVYFQPSLIENHSLCVVEAMGYGLPCVVSNVGGMPESVIDRETGFLLDPDDVEGFSQKILLCLENPEVAKNLGRKGMARAKELFSPELQEKKIIALYQK